MNTATLPSEETMLEAIRARDKGQDQRFFYGVITTGVFCLPSCSSREAKAENIRFFGSSHSAMEAGFRPCKRCRPRGNDAQNFNLLDIAQHIEKNASQSLTLEALAKQFSLSPTQLQRQFKKEFGISPKTFQDAVRFRRFKYSLQNGPSITDAVVSSGYGSTCRLYGEPTRQLGMSHKAYRKKGSGESIKFVCRRTDLGLLMIAATDIGVCFAEFGEDEESLHQCLKSEFSNAEISMSPSQESLEIDDWMDALVQHINEAMPRPNIPLDIRGTAFQMKVWKFLLSIKEGDVLSYTQVAAGIEQPKATRAVATACARNRIAVLIPCHCVLRSDGKLGGYRWGLERKQALLRR